MHTKVIGSRGAMPKTMSAANALRQRPDQADHQTQENQFSRIAQNHADDVPRCAPTAIRTPISLVWRATANDRTHRGRPLRAPETRPKAESRIMLKRCCATDALTPSQAVRRSAMEYARCP